MSDKVLQVALILWVCGREDVHDQGIVDIQRWGLWLLLGMLMRRELVSAPYDCTAVKGVCGNQAHQQYPAAYEGYGKLGLGMHSPPSSLAGLKLSRKSISFRLAAISLEAESWTLTLCKQQLPWIEKAVE